MCRVTLFTYLNQDRPVHQIKGRAGLDFELALILFLINVSASEIRT